MPKSSIALEGFVERLIEVNTLLSKCSRDENDLRKLPDTLRANDTFCRAAIVLLCSHVEGFFEDLIEDVLRFHEANATTIRDLPLRLRTEQVWKQFGTGEKAIDEIKWKAIQNLRAAKLADESAPCSAGIFDVDVHVHGFSTPGSSEIDSLLISIGVHTIWPSIAKVTGNGLLESRLNALVHRRHQIAHGDAGSRATVQDVEAYVQDVTLIAKSADAIVTSTIQETYKCPDPWAKLV